MKDIPIYLFPILCGLMFFKYDTASNRGGYYSGMLGVLALIGSILFSLGMFVGSILL